MFNWTRKNQALHLDGFATLLHKPLRRGGGSADAYALGVFKPATVDVGRCFDKMGVGIDLKTFVVEHPSVARLAAADEEDDVVVAGKVANVGNTVGHLTADGVVVVEEVGTLDVLLDELDNFAKSIERLGGLAVEGNGTAKVYFPLRIVKILNDDGMTLRLPHKSDDLGMTGLPVDDNLGVGMVGVFGLDAPLQVEHDGTGGINDLQVVSAGDVVGLRWFAVSPQQHFGIVKMVEVGVFDRLKAEFPQAFALTTIVYNITKAEEGTCRSQFLFCLANGGCDTEAES